MIGIADYGLWAIPSHLKRNEGLQRMKRKELFRLQSQCLPSALRPLPTARHSVTCISIHQLPHHLPSLSPPLSPHSTNSRSLDDEAAPPNSAPRLPGPASPHKCTRTQPPTTIAHSAEPSHQASVPPSDNIHPPTDHKLSQAKGTQGRATCKVPAPDFFFFGALPPPWLTDLSLVCLHGRE